LCASARSGWTCDAPFFQRDDGSALARSDVESLVREAAGEVGESQDRLTMAEAGVIFEFFPI
jgi:hypothetical protein